MPVLTGSNSAGMQVLIWVLVILILLLTLMIHELGHYTFAKIFKVNVKELSIGIGPKIFSWMKKNNEVINLRIIPIMAYVVLDSYNLRKLYEFDPFQKKHDFYNQKCPKGKFLIDEVKFWKYLLIMFAGIMFNLILFLVLWPTCSVAFQNAGYQFMPFKDLTNTFVVIGNNMIFNHSANSGSIFGQIGIIADSNQWGLIIFQLLVEINLITAIFNLFPIPPLDGYKISAKFYTYYSKKIVNEQFENLITIIGVILLLYIFISSIVVDFI